MSEENKFRSITDNLSTNVRKRSQVDEWAMRGIEAKRDEILAAFRNEAHCEPSEAVLVMERTKRGVRLYFRRQRESDHLADFLLSDKEMDGQ